MFSPTAATRWAFFPDTRPGLSGYGGQCERQLGSTRIRIGAYVKLCAERAAGQTAGTGVHAASD